MAKRKRSLREHIHHKSRLSFLLITKFVLAFVCFYLAFAIFSSIKGVFGNILAAALSLAVLFVLYLFILIRILKLFEFR